MSRVSLWNSTIFNKWVMGSTGVLLVLFILGHLAGNLQMFLGREVFNTYAHFLKSTGELLWIMRIVLLAAVVLHIITSIKLKFLNLAAKPQSYAKTAHDRSTVYSRFMIYSGLAIMFFVTYHLLHFTAFVTNPEYAELSEMYGPKIKSAGPVIMVEDELEQELLTDGSRGIFKRHDAYQMVIEGFKKPEVTIVYVLAMIFLALHLAHSVQSMLQTFGRQGPAYAAFSQWLAWLIAVGFISIPAGVITGIIGGN